VNIKIAPTLIDDSVRSTDCGMGRKAFLPELLFIGWGCGNRKQHFRRLPARIDRFDRALDVGLDDGAIP